MPTLKHRDTSVLTGEKKIDIPKASNGGSSHAGIKKRKKVVMDELGNMVLLIVLYCLQGVPMGLSGGAMPFLLQSKTSFTSIGVFSIASYPYSFKLLWSPIVDSVYSSKLGRRKSWIIPIQLMSAVVMVSCSNFANTSFLSADITALTVFFFVLVLLAATQDIAVDGWALTLLPKELVGYASTCQTIGMNIGYFTSFTVFLAFSDADFCNKYLRDYPSEVGIVTLESYLKFWGYAYAIATLVIIMKNESNDGDDDPRQVPNGHAREQSFTHVLGAYKQLWRVLQLRPVQTFSLILVTYRLGVLVAESAGHLKLLEKGVSKESLAGLVLLEFPMELVSAIIAGQWAASSTPFTPWIYGYNIRLIMAALMTFLVYVFPADAAHLSDHPFEFVVLGVFGVITSFTGTLMFTAIGSFSNKISDPDMGGAYLTLLNTIANMGIILPKVFLYWLMDIFTLRQCIAPMGEQWDLECPLKKSEGQGSNPCTNAGGTCHMARDGFYPLSGATIFLGLVVGLLYMRVLPRMQVLSPELWHAKLDRKES